MTLSHSRTLFTRSSAHYAQVLSSNPFLRPSPSSSSSATPSSQQRLSGTPNWSNASLEAVRNKYEAKYAERLQKLAREKGFSDVEELKKVKLQEVKSRPRIADALSRPKKMVQGSGKEEVGRLEGAPKLSQNTQSSSAASTKEKSPIKPLAEIVDLPKLLPQSSSAISQIWNAYHQLKTNTLSAVIPADVYTKMSEEAKRFPQFVVPLPRQIRGEGEEGGKMGAEMYFMQWAFFPNTSVSSLPLPKPSTVLYTPLAQYQTHQTFAQPHLILTHYTDLVPSHGIVLMRGDLTDSVSTKMENAQLLVHRLQQFYNPKKGDGKAEARSELLRVFHEEQDKFDIAKLVDSVGSL